MQLERQIQNQICELLTVSEMPFLVYDSKGSYDPVRKTFRRNTKYKVKGVSDLIVWNPITNQTNFIEIKTKKGRLSKNQLAFKKWCEKYGFNYEVWRSVEEAVEFLNNIKYR